MILMEIIANHFKGLGYLVTTNNEVKHQIVHIQHQRHAAVHIGIMLTFREQIADVILYNLAGANDFVLSQINFADPDSIETLERLAAEHCP